MSNHIKSNGQPDMNFHVGLNFTITKLEENKKKTNQTAFLDTPVTKSNDQLLPTVSQQIVVNI